MKNLQKVAEILDGSVWVKADKIRIYFKDDKDITAYLEYESMPESIEGDKALQGAVLKVFCSTKNQTGLFKVNKAKQKKHYFMDRIYNRLGCENFKPCDDWRNVIL